MSCKENNGDRITPRSGEIKSVVRMRILAATSEDRYEGGLFQDASITGSALDPVVWRFLVTSLDEDHC